MVASVRCHLCQPSIFAAPGEDDAPHHYGEHREQTMPGLLGGWVCSCPCASSEPPTPDPFAPDIIDQYDDCPTDAIGPKEAT